MNQISGFSRYTIAEYVGIGAGTVSRIVTNYKTGLEELDFDSIRQLAVDLDSITFAFNTD